MFPQTIDFALEAQIRVADEASEISCETDLYASKPAGDTGKYRNAKAEARTTELPL